MCWFAKIFGKSFGDSFLIVLQELQNSTQLLHSPFFRPRNPTPYCLVELDDYLWHLHDCLLLLLGCHSTGTPTWNSQISSNSSNKSQSFGSGKLPQILNQYHKCSRPTNQIRNYIQILLKLFSNSSTQTLFKLYSDFIQILLKNQKTLPPGVVPHKWYQIYTELHPHSLTEIFLIECRVLIQLLLFFFIWTGWVSQQKIQIFSEMGRDFCDFFVCCPISWYQQKAPKIQSWIWFLLFLGFVV